MITFRRLFLIFHRSWNKYKGDIPSDDDTIIGRSLVARFSWIFILISAILYNEWLCYRIQYSFMWSREAVQMNEPSDKILNVLLVADPQIQGYRDETPGLGIITRWDADRYLANSYYYALSFANPDLVVFLGDLIDEGSRATENEYKSYVKRIRQIFLDQTAQEKLILPGDNDVGGEGGDIKSIDKVLRFEKHFSRTYQLVSKKFVDFFMLDYSNADHFTSARLERAKRQLREMQRNRLKRFSVILNHENILPLSPVFYTPIFEVSRPNLLITGHSHQAFVMRCLRCWDSKGGVLEYIHKPEHPFTSYRSSLSTADVEGIIEIGVPTCSYRMGVPNMAYALLTMNSEGVVHYTNMWLPSRFNCLTIYIVAVILALFSHLYYRRRANRFSRICRS